MFVCVTVTVCCYLQLQLLPFQFLFGCPFELCTLYVPLATVGSRSRSGTVTVGHTGIQTGSAADGSVKLNSAETTFRRIQTNNRHHHDTNGDAKKIDYISKKAEEKKKKKGIELSFRSRPRGIFPLIAAQRQRPLACVYNRVTNVFSLVCAKQTLCNRARWLRG